MIKISQRVVVVCMWLGILLSLGYAKDDIKHNRFQNEIIEFLELSQSYDLAIKSFEPAFESLRDKYNNELSNENKILDNVWANIINNVMAEYDKDGYYSVLVPIYEKHLSEEDIREIIKFFKTPAGRRFVETMPDIMKESRLGGLEWAKLYWAKIVPRIKAKLIENGYAIK